MSTVKANTYQDASGGNTATINSMTPTADSLQGFRNRIINGDMRIDQRNAGASVTLTASGVYTVDRWQGFEDTDGVVTVQRNAGSLTGANLPTGFTNYLGATVTTADSSLGAVQYVTVVQKIEGFNVADLEWGTSRAKTVTLSFWVRSSLTGTFGGSVNNGGSRSYPFTYSISSASTWEYKTITIAGDTTGTWPTDNSIGLQINFGLGVGSTLSGTAGSWAGSNFVSATGATSVVGTLNATWYITGVQLEVGSVATPFERRPYGTELALCQRYCPVWTAGSTVHLVTGFSYSTTQALYSLPCPVSTRVSATGISVSGSAFASNGAATQYATTVTFNSGTPNTIAVIATSSAIFTGGQGSSLGGAGGSSVTIIGTGCEL